MKDILGRIFLEIMGTAKIALEEPALVHPELQLVRIQLEHIVNLCRLAIEEVLPRLREGEN